MSGAEEHRRLDEMLGRLIVALSAEDLAAARDEIAGFDAALRRHTEEEESRVFPPRSGRKLVPGEAEDDQESLARELTLEHVQIRELSGMMLGLLGKGEDLARARSLLPNLLRRWDAHCAREEREIYRGS